MEMKKNYKHFPIIEHEYKCPQMSSKINELKSMEVSSIWYMILRMTKQK